MPGLVPGIHDLKHKQTSKTWMAGTSPAMTRWRVIARKRELTQHLRRGRLGRARYRLRLAVFAAAHARAQFLRHRGRVDAVADHLRPNEDNQLGAGERLLVQRAGGIAQERDLIEERNAVARAALSLGDQAGEQHGLPGDDRNRTLDAALQDG